MSEEDDTLRHGDVPATTTTAPTARSASTSASSSATRRTPSGQTCANDDNANLKYPTSTPASSARTPPVTGARSRTALYDSYIRAIRWALNRIGDQASSVRHQRRLDRRQHADGIRLTLADEFDRIYVYNLRGNATHGRRTSTQGGRSRSSGRGAEPRWRSLSASRTTNTWGCARCSIATSGTTSAAKDKLRIVADGQLGNVNWQKHHAEYPRRLGKST